MMLTVDEYMALRRLIGSERESEGVDLAAREQAPSPAKKKRKISAYSRKYKTAFAKVRSTYQTSKGTWKKGGFRKAVKAAHKEAKK